MYDIPDERKVHRINNIPRLGGVLFIPAMSVGVAGTMVFMMINNSDKFSQFNMSTILVIIGMFLLYPDRFTRRPVRNASYTKICNSADCINIPAILWIIHTRFIRFVWFRRNSGLTQFSNYRLRITAHRKCNQPD